MRTTTYLNDFLYHRLHNLFGAVRVAHEGIGATIVPQPAGSKYKYRMTETGEYYCVDCPFCGDRKQRLWINHNWGVGVKEDKMLWAAHCYNDGATCMENWNNVKTLHNKVYYAVGRQSVIARVRPGKKRDRSATCQLPSNLVPVSELPEDHSIVRYMVDKRGFDLDLLSKAYGVSALPGIDMNQLHLRNRFVIPYVFNGKTVGWQARYCDELDWKASRIPKYYTATGFSKSAFIYNFDTARKFPFVIICEGMTDVWSAGPYSISLLGCTASQQQLTLLLRNWDQFYVALDRTKDVTDEVRAKLVDPLREKAAVYEVELPKGSDPDKLGAQAFMDIWIDQYWEHEVINNVVV